MLNQCCARSVVDSVDSPPISAHLGMFAQPHPTSRTGNLPRRAAPPFVGPHRASQFPPHPHSQGQSYPHTHHQSTAEDTRPGMDSVLYYQQYPPVQPQDRRRQDDQSSSSSSSPVLVDRLPADSMNANRKRINSAGAPGPARKKARLDDEGDESASPGDIPGSKDPKPKSTRGARYVLLSAIVPRVSADTTRTQGLHGLPPLENALRTEHGNSLQALRDRESRVYI